MLIIPGMTQGAKKTNSWACRSNKHFSKTSLAHWISEGQYPQGMFERGNGKLMI